MIKGIYLNGPMDDYSQCIQIRDVVVKELGWNKVFSSDHEDVHILLYNEDEIPVTSAGITFDFYGNFTIDYIVTLPEMRNKGYGEFVMHMIIDKAHMSGAKILQLESINHEFVSLFEKFGFVMLDDGIYILDLKRYYENRKCCGGCS